MLIIIIIKIKINQVINSSSFFSFLSFTSLCSLPLLLPFLFNLNQFDITRFFFFFFHFIILILHIIIRFINKIISIFRFLKLITPSSFTFSYLLFSNILTMLFLPSLSKSSLSSSLNFTHIIEIFSRRILSIQKLFLYNIRSQIILNQNINHIIYIIFSFFQIIHNKS